MVGLSKCIESRSSASDDRLAANYENRMQAGISRANPARNGTRAGLSAPGSISGTSRDR